MRISRLGPATETKSDRSEFIVRPVSYKRIKKKCMGADTKSWRFEFVPVSCKYPLTSCTIYQSQTSVDRGFFSAHFTDR